MTRFVAVHLSDGDTPAIRGTVRFGLAVSVAGSSSVALALYTLAPHLAAVFHDRALTLPLQLTAVALPASVITDAALSATQGFRTMKPYALIGHIFEPLARLGLTVVFVTHGSGVVGAMWALVISNYVAAGLALFALARRLPLGGPGVYRPRELFGFSMVSWVSSLASTGLIWADTVLLGLMRSSGEVGLYNVATRLVTLATFVMAPVNVALAPRIAFLYHRNERDALGRLYAAATGWILRLSLPAFVLLLVFPRDLLSAFGDSFRGAATVTMILAIGKLFDAGTGPCGQMLNMSGRVAVNMADNIAVLILNVALNLWLIPAYGITGAAVSWAASLVAVNVARVVQVWWITRLLPFESGVTRGVSAAAVAFGLGLLVRQTVGLTDVARATLGVATVLAAYFVVLVAMGFTSDDRAVLRQLTRQRSVGSM